jgi:uncharacterized membrane protein
VSANDWFLLLLRLAHSVAAMVWLGGGVYYLLALRPALRESGEQGRSVAGAAQRAFGEWAQLAALIMVATGAVLMFDRLSDGTGGVLYAVLLAAKVIAAIAAFWLAGIRPVRRRGVRRAAPELIAAFGIFAFVLGVVLSSVYGRTA